MGVEVNFYANTKGHQISRMQVTHNDMIGPTSHRSNIKPKWQWRSLQAAR
jgi:hypothetical protein